MIRDAIIFTTIITADRVTKVIVPHFMDLHQSIPVRLVDLVVLVQVYYIIKDQVNRFSNLLIVYSMQMQL